MSRWAGGGGGTWLKSSGPTTLVYGEHALPASDLNIDVSSTSRITDQTRTGRCREEGRWRRGKGWAAHALSKQSERARGPETKDQLGASNNRSSWEALLGADG
jgi:hypothetical protein